MKRYLYPTDQELRNIVGYPKEKQKKGKHNENGKTPDVFQIPRNIDITLEITPVTPQDVVHLKFYSDFQWLLDFSIYGVLVYFMTEVLLHFLFKVENNKTFYLLSVSKQFFYVQLYNSRYPIKDEINLSMLWSCLVIGFALYPFK